MNDTNLRTLIKTISWRLTGSTATFLISYMLLGNLAASGSIAIIQLVFNTILYYFHERTWNKVTWGKYVPVAPEAVGFDWKKPTVQMLGRWQPWHAGHRALFDRAIVKTGQVSIMIRDCEGWNNSNPFKKEEVENFIRADLDKEFKGKYNIIFVPNITNITYGRNVGYKIENEVFDEDTHNISATEIRKQMGLK
jgi:uncharacterized membrane protein/phosphopantetheine adenylyltransferase